jgi:hypothetical protein
VCLFLGMVTLTTADKKPQNSYPVTPLSIAKLLAYIQYYTPKRLPRGSLISPTHLRQLSSWIGLPQPAIRTLAKHKPLAASLVLLTTAKFLEVTTSTLCLLPATTTWLHASRIEQIECLLTAASREGMWQTAADKLRVAETMPYEYRIYIQQQLQRQSSYEHPAPETAVWLPSPAQNTWALSMPDTLPLWLHVDLRQIGIWQPDKPLLCTPATIGTALNNGYSLHMIQWLLETAIQQPLSAERTTQLITWQREAAAIKLRPVYLLSTNHPQKMANILRRKKLRKQIVDQISPRHAIVQPGIAHPLSRLFITDMTSLPDAPDQKNNLAGNETTAQQWLALRIMVGLGELVPLPYPPPHGLLDTLAHTLSTYEKETMEQVAQQTLHALRDAIQGRDAFFPARHPINPDHLALIEDAINKEEMLTIQYQALGSYTSRSHQIDPFWIDKRGELYYLSAYSTLSESNLTFRLDRITEIVKEKR